MDNTENGTFNEQIIDVSFFMSDEALDKELTIDRKIELLKIAKDISFDKNSISTAMNYEFLIRTIRVNPSSFQKCSNMTLLGS